MDQNSFTPPQTSMPQAEAPAFAPTSTPPTPPTPPQTPPVMPEAIPPAQESHKGRNTALFIVLCVIALGVLGVAYAYVEKIGPFSKPPYKEESFLSDFAKNISKINSATSEFSMSFDSTIPRDKDAVPFALKDTDPQLAQKYQNDYDRAQDVSKLLNLMVPRGSYVKVNNKYTWVKPAVKFKSDLSAVVTSTSAGANLKITDPGTNKQYEYKTTDGGTNFALSVTFETDAAIKAIKKGASYAYEGASATSTTFDGKKVTFTKDSSSYIYISSTLPKPALEELGQMFVKAPTDMKAGGSITISANEKENKAVDSDVVFDFSGSFGDLSLAINIEARKKDEIYFIRINKMPSLLGDLSVYKNKWISIDVNKLASSTDYSFLSRMAKSASSSQQSSIIARDKMISRLRKILAIADEQKVVYFKNAPHTESINGKQLYRYDLGFHKDSFVSFYKKIADELSKDQDYRGVITEDQGLLDYLQSDEFNQTFDYYDKNITLSLWFDDAGMPIVSKLQMRIVPPDEAKQFKDKQVVVTFTLKLSNINKQATITAPSDAIPLEEITKGSMGLAEQKGKDAQVKAKLYGIRSQVENVYSMTNNSYGKTPFSLGVCTNKSGTLFGDSSVYQMITDIKKANPTTEVICVSSGSNGKVTAYAVSATLSDTTYSWCVDSTGESRQIVGKLKGSACR